MDYFSELIKIKSEIDKFLFHHEIDDDKRISATSELFTIFFQNQFVLIFLEKTACKNLPASEMKKIKKSLNEIGVALSELKSVDGEAMMYLSMTKVSLQRSLGYDFVVDDICLSRKILLDSVLSEFFNWSVKYGYSFSTSNGLIPDGNIFHLFVKGFKYIGFQEGWFGSFGASDGGGLVRRELIAFKKNRSNVSRVIPVCMKVISEVGRRNGLLI